MRNLNRRTRTIRTLAGCALASLMLLGACVIEADPECGDGEANGDDGCDGDDFDKVTCISLGFDDGALSCTQSCGIDTSGCVIFDEDQDQLTIYDEEAWGTDPLNPDTDGDGVLDGVEAHNGSDPLNWTSWPGHIGGWPNHLQMAIDAQLTPTGYNEGDVIFNRTWTDQFGQVVNLHQFYGYVTVLTVGARWCPPCQQAARTSQALLDQHKAEGVVLVEHLREGLNPDVFANQQDAVIWAETFELQYPVVVEEIPLIVPSVPTYYILDRELRIRTIYEGFPGDAALSSAINSAVANSDSSGG